MSRSGSGRLGRQTVGVEQSCDKRRKVRPSCREFHDQPRFYLMRDSSTKLSSHGLLYIGGIVPEDSSLDMAGQASDVLSQLSRLLEAQGSDRSHVLQVTIFLAELSEKAAFNAAWKAF